MSYRPTAYRPRRAVAVARTVNRSAMAAAALIAPVAAGLWICLANAFGLGH